MNQRVLSGALVAGIGLATFGAAVTATDGIPSSSQSAVLASEPFVGGDVEDLGTAQAASKVPVRSGLLADEAPTASADLAAVPTGVRIIEIGLDASVLSVGVDEQNRFAVPAADTVGWYQYSALPGSPGATVLAAHVDYGGRPGAFFNLSALRPGDRLEVDLSDGSTLAYRVTGNSQYDKSELPAEELFRKDGSPVLQLITCGGTFDPEKRSYRANVVVTAAPIQA